MIEFTWFLLAAIFANGNILVFIILALLIALVLAYLEIKDKYLD